MLARCIKFLGKTALAAMVVITGFTSIPGVVSEADAFTAFRTRFGGGLACKEIEITYSMQNVVLKSLAENQGWNGSSDICLTIEENVLVTGSNASWPAIRYGSIDPDVEVYIFNKGSIIGRGGKGGRAGKGGGDRNGGATYGGDGQDGGDAIHATRTTYIFNDGLIAAGGGGGGGGAGGTCRECYDDAGGGGGGGAPYGLGGQRYYNDDPNCYEGDDASANSGGSYGYPCPNNSGEWASGNRGGRGGGIGEAGDDGIGAGNKSCEVVERQTGDGHFYYRTICSPWYDSIGGDGGHPGFAIDGISSVTWIDEDANEDSDGRGTILGRTK